MSIIDRIASQGASDRHDSTLPPFVEWPTFWRSMRWRQGEHVTLIGQTGSGKTTLGLALLPLRRFVLVVATKPRDATMRQLKRQGYHVTRTWPVSAEVYERVVFWPKIAQMRDVIGQRNAIADCLESVYASGGWTVYLDELRYLADPSYLGLRSHLAMLWTQGRSMNVTIVGGSQRPAWVPLEAFSQVRHLFFFRESDDTNLKKVASIAGLRSGELREIVPRLPEHEALYVHTDTGRMVRTLAPRPDQR